MTLSTVRHPSGDKHSVDRPFAHGARLLRFSVRHTLAFSLLFTVLFGSRNSWASTTYSWCEALRSTETTEDPDFLSGVFKSLEDDDNGWAYQQPFSDYVVNTYHYRRGVTFCHYGDTMQQARADRDKEESDMKSRGRRVIDTGWKCTKDYEEIYHQPCRSPNP